jgi:hypothetical protein
MLDFCAAVVTARTQDLRNLANPWAMHTRKGR